MKLIELTCSGCGAKLEVMPGQERYFCQYCGKEFVMDREINYYQEIGGYENEYGKMKGRLDAQRAFMEEQEQARIQAEQEAFEKQKQAAIESADKLAGVLRILSLVLGGLGILGIILGIVRAAQGYGALGIVSSIIAVLAGLGILLFISAGKNLIPVIILAGISMVLLVSSLGVSGLYLIPLAANIVSFIFLIRVQTAARYRQ